MTCTKSLYESDFVQWSDQTAQLLREQRFSELDLAHLIEEVEDLSGRERDALYSNLKIVLLHLLKWHYQSHKRSNSWRSSIVEHRQRIQRQVKKSPSLKSYPSEIVSDCYSDARELASVETGLPLVTFPVECPYAITTALNPDFLPD